MIVLDDVIVVLGTAGNAAVSLFTREGKFICPLVRIGRGPDEMTDVVAVAYNPYSETLDVLGNMGTMVNCYDIAGRTLKSNFSIMETEIMSARDFCPVSATEYLFYKDYGLLESQEYFVYSYDSASGAVKDRFLPMDKELAEMLSFGQSNNLFSYDGAVYYYAAFGHYVYSYKDGNFSPFLEFAPNMYSFPDDLLHGKYNDVVDFVENTCKKSSYIWAHINMYRYGRYMMSSYTYKDDIYFNVINLKNGKSKSYDMIEDDMVWGFSTGDFRSVLSLVSTDERYAVYSAEPFAIKDIIAGSDASSSAVGNPEKACSENRDLLQRLPDDANPVLLLMSSGK